MVSGRSGSPSDELRKRIGITYESVECPVEDEEEKRKVLSLVEHNQLFIVGFDSLVISAKQLAAR